MDRKGTDTKNEQKNRENDDTCTSLRNVHLLQLERDIYYHLGLDSTIGSLFEDVRFVLLSGSADRAHTIAQRVAAEIPGCGAVIPLGKTDRYSLYKVGAVLAVSHGIGMPSMSIVLHEITKLLLHAAKLVPHNICYIRLGTSGGIGVAPGTQVITRRVLNSQLQPYHCATVLGKPSQRPTDLDTELMKQLLSSAAPAPNVISGDTLTTDDFYEGQGRLDGAIAEYSDSDKMCFLRQCQAGGVVNIEMEAVVFAAFCRHLSIPAAVVCAVIVDRLRTDQITSSPADLLLYSAETITLVLKFVQQQQRVRL